MLAGDERHREPGLGRQCASGRFSVRLKATARFACDKERNGAGDDEVETRLSPPGRGEDTPTGQARRTRARPGRSAPQRRHEQGGTPRTTTTTVARPRGRRTNGRESDRPGSGTARDALRRGDGMLTAGRLCVSVGTVSTVPQPRDARLPSPTASIEAPVLAKETRRLLPTCNPDVCVPQAFFVHAAPLCAEAPGLSGGSFPGRRPPRQP